eukprot:gene8374-biopygen18118
MGLPENVSNLKRSSMGNSGLSHGAAARGHLPLSTDVTFFGRHSAAWCRGASASSGTASTARAPAYA